MSVTCNKLEHYNLVLLHIHYNQGCVKVTLDCYSGVQSSKSNYKRSDLGMTRIKRLWKTVGTRQEDKTLVPL